MGRVLRTPDRQPLITGMVGPTPIALLATPGPAAAAAGMPFFTVAIEAYQPPGTALTPVLGWNLVPWNLLSLRPIGAGSTTKITASDMGYRTRAGDAGGVVPYPALIADSIQLDREIPLDPATTAAAAGGATVVLINDDGHLDGIASSMNADGRRAEIRRGTKVWDAGRGLFVDPSLADLDMVFAGVATPWFLDVTTLRVLLRDASYWLERPYQANLYTGAGGINGSTALTGIRIPRTRGGTAGHPVKNITPVLIDPVKLIYQYNDGPGAIVTLWEGAKATIAFSGDDTTDLFSGTTPPGTYRTDDTHGLFQLGSPPAYAITADVTGEFPVAGAVTTAAAIALAMLTEDLGLAAEFVDADSFAAADSAYPYIAGIYFHPDDAADGAAAVSRVLSGMHAKLIHARAGELRCCVLRALSGTETPVLTIGPHNSGEIVPVPLPATLDPPAVRVRVAWQHNHTVQASGLNPEAPAAQVQFAAASDSYAFFGSPAVAAQFARPNDLAPFGGSLLVRDDVDAVAADVGALWCARRRLFDVPLPLELGVGLDLGDVLRLRDLTGELRSGRLGQIVGTSLRSNEDMMTVRVLV
ncbi:MAG: hypothetical protein WDN25_04010 [Acetobacteraceae bacterium]